MEYAPFAFLLQRSTSHKMHCFGDRAHGLQRLRAKDDNSVGGKQAQRSLPQRHMRIHIVHDLRTITR